MIFILVLSNSIIGLKASLNEKFIIKSICGVCKQTHLKNIRDKLAGSDLEIAEKVKKLGYGFEYIFSLDQSYERFMKCLDLPL